MLLRQALLYSSTNRSLFTYIVVRKSIVIYGLSFVFMLVCFFFRELYQLRNLPFIQCAVFLSELFQILGLGQQLLGL